MLILLAALTMQPSGTGLPPLVPPSTPAEAAIHAKVRSQTEAYLNARRQLRFDTAWSLVSDERRAQRPRPSWEAGQHDFALRAGAFRGQRITGVILTQNPDGLRGSFATVEYSADYAKLAFLCGIVVWRLQPDGRWQVHNELLQAAVSSEVANPTPETIAEGRRYANCRD